MQEEEKESVVEDQNPSQDGGGEVPGAQDDLDRLLDEFDQAEQQPAPQTGQQPQEDASELVQLKQQVQALTTQQAEKSLDDGVDEAVGLIKGSMGDTTYTDDEIKDIAWGKVAQDKRLYNLFINRGSNPQAFKKAFGTLGAELSKRSKSRLDPDATQQAVAVDAVVRGSSPPAAEDKNAVLDNANSLSGSDWATMADDLKKGKFKE